MKISFKISTVHYKRIFFFRAICTYLHVISAFIPTYLDSRQRVKDSTTLEDSMISSVSEPEAILKSSGVQFGKKEDVQTAQNIVCSPPETSYAWQPEDADVPQVVFRYCFKCILNQGFIAVPECYTKVAESKFPIPVEEFFQLFFSDNGASFLESFHKKCGDKDFKCSSWQPLMKFWYSIY